MNLGRCIYLLDWRTDTIMQYIQTRQEKKLYLAQLGWDSVKTESSEEKLQKVIVSFTSLLYMYLCMLMRSDFPENEIFAVNIAFL
jgi:hypothetical protein